MIWHTECGRVSIAVVDDANVVWATCDYQSQAEQIAAALNAQESQLTRGIYPPITESIEAGPFVETVDVKPFDPDAGPAGRVEVSRKELEKLYPSSSRADAEDSF